MSDAGTVDGARRFFSGETEAQAVLEAAAALGVAPGELAYERKQGNLRRGRVVIAVDPAEPRRPAPATAGAGTPHPAPAAPLGGRSAERARAGSAGRAESAAAAWTRPTVPPLEPFAPAQGAEGGRAALAAVAGLADLELRAEVALVAGPDGDEVRVEIVGPDAGVLTADRGELLRATEYLLRRMVRDLPPGGLVADSGGYRAAREDELRRRATAAAEEVRRTGQPVVFEPLPASERRIVHVVIQDEAGVVSGSEGEGDLRRVRVAPAAAEPAS